MSYWRDDEEVLQGFTGPSYEGFGQSLDAALCAYFPQQCAALSQKEAALKALQAAAAAKITNLAGQSWCGPVLAEALEGARDPEAIAIRAKQLADGLSGDALQKAAYRLFYARDCALADVLDAASSIYPSATAVAGALKAGIPYIGSAAQALQKMAEAGWRLDPLGVVDVGAVVKQGVSGARFLIKTLADAGYVSQDTAFMMDWAVTGAGCMAGVAVTAATGPGVAVGAMGCAISALSSVFAKLSVPLAPSPDPLVPQAVFTPAESQLPTIAADAARLAMVLRYFYGASSYGGLRPAYPSAVYRALQEYTPIGQSAPGYTTRDVAQFLHRLPVLKVASAVSFPGYGAFVNGKPDIWNDRTLYGDLTAAHVRTRGAFARQLVSAGLFWKDVEVYNADGWAFTGGAKYLFPPQYRVWKVYEELLNLFAAATKREAQTNFQVIDDLLKSSLPVRLWGVGAPYAGDPRTNSEHYSSMALSSYDICGSTTRNTLEVLRKGVLAGSDCAVFEIANLRLLAAFSYMHTQYNWGGTLAKPADMIAQLPALSLSDPASQLRLPVDPRDKTATQVYAEIAALENKLKAVADAARKQAQLDAMVVTPAAQAGIKFAVQQQQALQQLPVLQTTGFKLPPPTGGGAGTVITLAALALIAAKLLR